MMFFLCRTCSAYWGIDLDASSALAFLAVMFCAEVALLIGTI